MEYFKKKALCGLFAVLVSNGITADPNLTAEDMEIVRQSKAISEAASSLDLGIAPNPYMKEARQEAQEVFSVIKENNPALFSDTENDPAFNNAGKLLLFVSHSMGDNGLQAALSVAAGQENITMVFRGIPEGERIGKELLKIQKLALKNGVKANIVIDPGLFKKHDVYSVPVQVLTGGNGEEVSRVTGIVDTTWLLTKASAGEYEDFGNIGPTRDISEPDLIEVMKARAGKIDWESKKKAALARFWDKQTFYDLLPAPKDQVRTIDPTVVITQDITTPDGTVVAFAGQKINPLELRPFNQAVIVFDGTNPADIKIAEREFEKLRSQKKVTLITTRFDRVKGWDGYKKLTDKFNAPVFLLTSDIKARFKLRHAPTVITANDHQFIATEHVRPMLSTKNPDVNDGQTRKGG